MRGLTLVELLIAATIVSLLSVVLGGLALAVQTAREHTEGLEEAMIQSQIAMDRIRFMVAEAGVYRVDDEPTKLGLAVVVHQTPEYDRPDILVVWSGGRTGGMAAAGVQTRLPRIDELVVFTLAPENPTHLVELTFPGNTSRIDFDDLDFADTIRTLVVSSQADEARLCDRVRVSRLSLSTSLNEQSVGNIRFELDWSPTAAALAATTPGTAAWYDLQWSQGIVTGESGMRQATLRMEFQVEPRPWPASSTESAPIAIPFFGSASYRYVYRP